MKRLFLRMALLLLYSLASIFPAKADQGMWLPLLLKQMNEERMQELGMKMSAEDIYSINEGSLKDAIVSFGGYCTGQVISDQGLLLTNHHCGYGVIQSHSSVENDLLTDGFWAGSLEEEIASPGLHATFIIRIEDVTEKVLAGITEETPEIKHESMIRTNIAEVSADAIEGTHYRAEVKPFFEGSEYYLFVTERFEDVRLVGAPPTFIGKYGGDTDNWEWPRHVGDFSLFRIYAAPDGKPAPYSEDNVPLKPRRSLSISLAGIQPGDFTMVFGFPGRTQQYLTSDAVKLLVEETNPHRIGIRETKLEIMNQHMQASDRVRIAYASKYASTANYWKKWIGESMGLERYDAVMQKEKLEAEFMDWVAEDADRKAKYGSVLEDIAAEVKAVQKGNVAYQYLREGLVRHDAIQYFQLLYALSSTQNESEQQGLTQEAERFLKNFDLATDKAVLGAMLEMYRENVPQKYHFSAFASENDPVADFYAGDWLSMDWLEKYAEDPAEHRKALFDLPALEMLGEIQEFYEVARRMVSEPQGRIDALTKIYIEGLREMNADQAFAPDANSTLRVAYGTVGGMEPRDGLVYRHYTTLDGVIAKEEPGVANTHEFFLDTKIKELAEERDYGRWADEQGYLPVNFLASNHTTGGNSGSPILDAEGNLIGLNFDRTWQSTMSDVMYNAEICRNIAVDVRYIGWVVEKYAGADRLIEEMNFVNVPATME
ncbi:MAG: S46 family peptidase [Bacteroidota bacterium]